MFYSSERKLWAKTTNHEPRWLEVLALQKMYSQRWKRVARSFGWSAANLSRRSWKTRSAFCLILNSRIRIGRRSESNTEFLIKRCVERTNLNMRMGMHRFTRLTNGRSKNNENREHTCALYFFATTFAASTPPCAARPLWLPVSRPKCGNWPILLTF